MTLHQFLKEVYSLGFEDVGEFDEGFVFAANRALKAMHADFGEKRECALFIPPVKISYLLDEHTLSQDSQLEVLTNGAAALSFSYSGVGECTLIFNNGSTSKRGLSGPSGEVKLRLEEVRKVVFKAKNPYTVYNFALFSSLPDDDIPSAYGFRKFKVSRQIPDFSIPTGAPRDSLGKEISGAYFEKDCLVMPIGFFGNSVISYKSSPPEISLDTEYDDIIPITSAAEHLLPLLTAAYFWLDDDEEKSSYYMALYNEGARKLQRTLFRGNTSSYVDVTGWAK